MTEPDTFGPFDAAGEAGFMGPKLHFLDTAIINRIVDEAKIVLEEIGVEVQHEEAAKRLIDHGSSIDAATGEARTPLTSDCLSYAKVVAGLPEIEFPGPVIDRAGRSRWVEDGRSTIEERAAAEVDRLVADHTPSRLPDTVRCDLEGRMLAAAGDCGMDALPDRSS